MFMFSNNFQFGLATLEWSHINLLAEGIRTAKTKFKFILAPDLKWWPLKRFIPNSDLKTQVGKQL